MQQRMFQVINEEMQGLVNDLLKGLISPEKILELMKSMGIDLSQLSGMMGQQTGFNPYLMLGLERTATDEEVKKRYREMVNILHPDKSGTPATGIYFDMVQKAYEMIGKERGWQ